MGKLIKLGLPAAAIVAAVVFLVSDRNTMLDTEQWLSAIAADIAQRSVTVDCKGLVADAVDVSGDEGTVEFDAAGNPADSTVLKRNVCTTLASFPADRLNPRFACIYEVGTCSQPVIESIEAIHTLAHEAWHLRGIKDERITTCYAIQTTAWTAERLGADSPQAHAIARYFARERYPKLRPSYQAGDCRDGGRYDLNRGSHHWP